MSKGVDCLIHKSQCSSVFIGVSYMFFVVFFYFVSFSTFFGGHFLSPIETPMKGKIWGKKPYLDHTAFKKKKH